MLLAIGVAGFLLQFLLTEGLQREKAGRATNLIVSGYNYDRHRSTGANTTKSIYN